MSETRRRILVVEDQRIISADLENTLGKLGYEVVGVAPSGEEAVGKAARLAPDLVLMDIRLRGVMDGIEAARVIRERFGTPVVYLTAYADEETIARARLTTPFGFIVKPFNPRELRAAIEIALYKHETDRLLDEERARRRVAEEYRLLIESIEDYAIFRLDPAGRIASWNVGAEQITGYDADEIAGRHVSVLYPDDAASALEQTLTRVEDEGRVEHEGWQERNDGQRFWGRITITAVRDGDDVVRGYAVVVRDLTERRAYEQALRESEQRFRTTVVHAPVPVMLHAEDGEVLAVSDALARSMGYPAERIVEVEDWLELTYGEHAAEARALARRAFREGRAETLELPVRVTSGEVQQWHLTVSEPVLMREGRRAVCIVAADVSKQRQAEQALQEAHRQKDEFIAMLGHELRNPLAAVRSATELLKLVAGDDPRYRRTQAVLERQTAHMAKLLDDLLDVSRIVSGRVHLDRAPIDLKAVLQETIAGQADAIGRRGQALVTNIAEEALWVCGDRVRLVQVFENLISNATKFTESSGKISISAHAEGDAVIVAVGDTGAGIDSVLLPHIFEPFRQAEQSLVRTPGGLGLGLAIVKGMVELHDGSVTAHSDGPGRGAMFTVRLPLVAQPRDQADSPMHRAPSCRVMVIEDNQDAAETLRMVLEALGHEVSVAYDGESALRLVSDFCPEVVLCDIGLPGAMSGYDLAPALRARSPGNPDGRALLVAVTGYGRPEDIRRAHEAGFDRHLTKPIGVADIEAILAER